MPVSENKTAVVLAHTIRPLLTAEMEGLQRAGEVELDGTGFDGEVCPANHDENRKNRREGEHRNGERRVVIALREREGQTRTSVAEREAEGVALAVEHVDPEAAVHADEAAYRDALHGAFDAAGRIDHAGSHSTEEASSDQADSYFPRPSSRTFRCVASSRGQVHAPLVHASGITATSACAVARRGSGKASKYEPALWMARARRQRWFAPCTGGDLAVAGWISPAPSPGSGAGGSGGFCSAADFLSRPE